MARAHQATEAEGIEMSVRGVENEAGAQMPGRDNLFAESFVAGGNTVFEEDDEAPLPRYEQAISVRPGARPVVTGSQTTQTQEAVVVASLGVYARWLLGPMTTGPQPFAMVRP